VAHLLRRHARARIVALAALGVSNLKSVNQATWTKTERSDFLSGRPARDTKPELALRKAVHSLGGRYRLHKRVGPRSSADFAFVSEHVAVFVDGCFWHGCPEHGRRNFQGPNAQLWKEKIERNKRRDLRISRMAAADGWLVIRMWECDVLRDPGMAARSIMKVLRQCRRRQRS
jgi:DNA mismatch endonuclease, patch repair protein